MKTILTLSTLLLFIFNSSAQLNNTLNTERLTEVQMFRFLDTKKGKINLNKVEGSPYLQERFIFGKVIDTKNDESFKAPLRYNIFKDQMEINISDYEDKVSVLDRTTQYEYEIQGKKFIFLKNDFLFENADNGFVELIGKSGDAMIVKRYWQKFTPQQPARTSYQDPTPARLSTEFDYFISKDNGLTFEEIDPHKRRILDSFEDKKSEIKSYIKDKDMKFRGDEKEVENQLQRVIYYYDTL
ncbi:hypothetical protein [Psychroflexus aestuariivivens]|uniref:hypothetical protein n=1 Tax=Psychroflexus aestuariivivens TaxID=1795040 RepID=UPI000FD944C5|nr:hypothetical protein [Psychroflexus aestuariivivens]